MNNKSHAAPGASGEDLFTLGVMHASGAAADLVTAHKWFNLAALRGHCEAAQRRIELAAQMTPQEVAMAQRAARDWLKAH